MTRLSPERTAQVRRARALWLPSLILSAVTGGATLAMWLVRAGLPTRIANHEGIDGTPDGWTTLGGAMAETLLIPLGAALVLLAIGVATKQRAAMAGLATGLGIFLTAVAGGMTLVQHADSPWRGGSDPLLLLGLAVGAPLGLLVWRMCREPAGAYVVSGQPLPPGAEVLGDVADTARLAWIGRTRVSGTAFVVAGILAVVPTLVLAVIGAWHGSWGLAIIMMLTAALVVILGGCMWARVTVDARGVRARSWGIGWVTIPLDAVVGARRDDIAHPLGEFGGWGLRTAVDGTRALLTSAGEALRIERAGQPDWVITLDHADDAARTLNTLVERRGARS